METFLGWILFILSIALYFVFPVAFSSLRRKHQKKTKYSVVLWVAVANAVIVRGITVIALMARGQEFSADISHMLVWGSFSYFIMRTVLKPYLYRNDNITIVHINSSNGPTKE